MRRALLFVLSFVACTIDSSVQFGSGAGGGPDDVDPITGEPRDSGAHTGGSSGNGNGSSSGEPPPPPHCGDPGAPLCADGEACRGDTDCMSVNCMDALCKQPTSDDNRKNGTESDVDCGGDAAPKCGVGKRCTQHSDCTTDACPSGVCVSSHSCRNHFGGDTCGAGEVGEPNAQHEDCCLSIQPDQQPYRLDKYLITAGRMRAFIDDVRAEFGGVPNVRAWVAAHPDRVPFWNAEWNDSLPSDEGQLVRLIGTGQNPGAGWGSPGRAAGCYVAGNGAPTYWHDDQNVGHAGDIPRGFSREQLDVKALNCTPAGLLAAFCGYDGGRLPTSAEWVYSVRGAQTAAQHELPWGNPPAGASDADVDKHICGAEGIAGGRSGLFNLACVAVGGNNSGVVNGYAAYSKNYRFPLQPWAQAPAESQEKDTAFEVAAPGRFPKGAGPYGHRDALGLVEIMVLDGTQFKMIRQYAFQEAYYNRPKYGTNSNMKFYTSHYAIGARCARPLLEE